MSNSETHELSVVPPISKESADAFWRCFLEREDAYFEMPIAELMDALTLLIGAYAPALAMEVGGDWDDSERELILTAHGDKAQFHSLEMLQLAAPELKRFSKVIAFRRRVNHPEFGISMDRMELLAKDIQVGLFDDRGLVGLELTLTHAVPSTQVEHAQHMAFIMLDHVIGEYDFAVRVGYVEFVDRVSNSAVSTCALNELPDAFDRMLRETLGHNWEWPEGREKTHWVMLKVPSKEDDGRPNIVSVRHDANSLALRADLAYCLDVKVDVEDQDSVERARDLQEALCHLLETDHSAILVLTMVMMDEGMRICRFYSGDPSDRMQRIREVCQGHGFNSPRVGSTFDPSWDGYFEYKR